MKNAEAIYYLERIKNSYTPFLTEEETAIDMAIATLEKPKQKKPLTYADKVRAMTDEELACFIARQRFSVVNQIADKFGIDVTTAFIACQKNVLKSLKQEGGTE